MMLKSKFQTFLQNIIIFLPEKFFQYTESIIFALQIRN
jgi:hypothetical protein